MPEADARMPVCFVENFREVREVSADAGALPRHRLEQYTRLVLLRRVEEAQQRLRDVRRRGVYARVHREARVQHYVVEVQVAAALDLLAQRGGAFSAHRRVGRGYG